MKTVPAGRRQHAERRGRFAETLALLCLRAKGYRCLARRVKTPVGEVDLICRRGGVLVLVEVKARADFDTAAASISPRQWQRIARAGEWWMASKGGGMFETIRCDAILVAGWRVRHLRNVWQQG